MQSKEDAIKDFLLEVTETFYESIFEVARKYGLEKDYAFILAIGAYGEPTEEGINKLIVSMGCDVDSDEEFNTLIDASENIYDNNTPERGTIDWWINNYGNGSVN